MIHSVHILQPFFAFILFLMFWIWEDEFSQLRGMLSNMLIVLGIWAWICLFISVMLIKKRVYLNSFF